MKVTLARVCAVTAKNVLLVVVVLFLLALSCFWIGKHDKQFLDTITELLSEHTLFLCLFRLSLIFLFVLCWPKIIRVMSRHNNLAWQRERWRILSWLIVFELLVCENLLGKLIHLIGN